MGHALRLLLRQEPPLDGIVEIVIGPAILPESGL
jgi:hypothetical protein